MINMTEVDAALASTTGNVNIQVQTVRHSRVIIII
jgi:hypothetical protein